MVAMKKKALTKKSTALGKKSAKTKQRAGAVKKVRIGVCVGKDFDPVKKGTQPPDFPKKLMLTKDDWGKYSVDAVTALQMKELHPDLLEIDIIPTLEFSSKRLKKNHVNLTFWPEPGVAINTGKKKLVDEYFKAFKDPSCRLDPQWNYYDWILFKPRYMEQCIKSGIPMIPTVFYKNGITAAQVLKDVQKNCWDKFFLKLGQYAFFGFGAINGKTADFLPGGKKEKELKKFAEEHKKAKVFLLQPYMLKPNGEVFDEVRNFFIDGQWRYSVFTHGTDGSDAGFYEEPEGPRKAACKAMAEKAYQEVLRTNTWDGKKQAPLLNRIDIGVIPKKGADSLHKTDNQYFCNEIEFICTTWLDRYSPINVADTVSHAAIKHSMELLAVMLKTKKRVPDEANVRKVVKMLNDRLGPFKHIKL